MKYEIDFLKIEIQSFAIYLNVKHTCIWLRFLK